MKKFKSQKGLGIKHQVLVGFLIFTAIILILLWVFQILLLNPFYEIIKQSEVNSVADGISQSFKHYDENDESLDSLAEFVNEIQVYSKDTDVFITVSGKEGNLLCAVNPKKFKMFRLERLINSSIQLKEIFYLVKDSGGIYTQRFHDGVEENKSLLNCSIIQSKTGTEYLIMIESEITPVDSTVDTLKVQLLCLTAVMLALGIAVAILISSRISKPIISINETAKKLAKGNYIKFDESGSVEVQELAQTLNFASTELSKVEALRRELISNVSHDLRTPLTMIKGYGEVMRDLPNENTPENVQIIIDETERLTRLVNDMLDISKLESGNASLDISEFNLTNSIRDILNRYDKFSDYKFIFNYKEEVFVKADSLKISQVIYNLINNAINYIGEDKTVNINQIVKNNKVRVEVIDNGIGIPEDKIKDIWDRYYKIDKEHKRGQVGTGLGLSIVKNILNMHGGNYGVSSKYGSGSMFWFELDISMIENEPE